MTFQKMGLSDAVIRALEEAGFSEPTPIQEQVIPLQIGHNDVIGQAQTGTGKTAAFALPVLQKIKYAQDLPPRALVLVPTKELVIQVHEVFCTLANYTDLRCLALFGGVGPKTQLEQLEQGADILIATPGRFNDLVSRGTICLDSITFVILDEADRMLDMGFEPQIRNFF